MTAATKRLSLAVAVGVAALTVAACALVAPSGAASEPAGTRAPQAATPAAPVTTAILTGPADAAIGRYGTRTSATFAVVAQGSKLTYAWQQRAGSSGTWKAIAKATKSTYVAKAATWKSGTQFRVVVRGSLGSATSAPATLTVLLPTKTPARDAETAFGLTGLRQGVDMSAYQYTPAGRVKTSAIAAWAGADGFALLRNGSGARPIRQSYTDACTNKTKKTGAKPVTQDCAYAVLADKLSAGKLSLGHYWFNGWIDAIDTTKADLFAGGYTPAASARQFVTWLKRDGHYTTSSTDPLVLDVEKGHAWTRTSKGKTYTVKLRAWRPAEAAEFLTTVKSLLTRDGYHANLYVYMSANATMKVDPDTGSFVWTPVAGIARLWVASWGTNNGRIPQSLPKVGPWEGYDGWSIWQYTSNARIAGDGLPGGLDADIATADAWTPRAS